MRLREVLLKVHLWLGMTLGLVLVVVSVTGGMLVFAPEIDGYLNHRLYAATAGDVGHELVLTSVRAEYPGQRVNLLWFPAAYRPVYGAYLRERASDEPITVYVDPGTGRILGTSREQHAISRVIDFAGTLHVNLMAGEAGRQVVAWSVLLFTGVLVSGLFLWWPGITRLASGFRIRTGKNWFLANFDLHRVMGAVAFPFLLVMALTGLVMAFPNTAQWIVHGLFLSAPDERSERVAEPLSRLSGEIGKRPTTDDFLATAKAEVPDADIIYLTFPDEPEEAVQVRMQQGVYPYPFGTTFRIYLDQYTGQVVHVNDPRKASTPGKVLAWNYPLHVGSVGGVPLRVVYLLATIAPPLLMVTGVLIWWQKRSKRGKGVRNQY
jgi:uncharacterized iron-regulated membrane protein